MKLKDILLESPLPNDWDISGKNLKDIIQYALERSQYIGEGCSRTCVVLPDNTVLKIAKNEYGLEANKNEIMLFNKYKDICIPLIDYDNRHRWIQVEFADVIDDYHLPLEISYFSKKWETRNDDGILDKWIDMYEDEYPSLVRILKRFPDLEKDGVVMDDITNNNIGTYDDEIVLIDLGFVDTCWEKL